MKALLNKDTDWWNSVILRDESKLNPSSSDGRIIVRRKSNEELQERNLKATMKHSGGNPTGMGLFVSEWGRETGVFENFLENASIFNY